MNETSHKEHILSLLTKDEKRNNGFNDNRVGGENGVTRVKRNVKSRQSVSTRSSKGKKNHKARKPL